MKFYAALLCGALAGCTTAPTGISDKEIMDYPEGRAYAQCTINSSRAYARQQGGPYELGIAVAARCSSELYKLEQAMLRDSRPSYVRRLISRIERSAPADAASMIAEIRSRQ